jgi:hypothetical protein
MILPGFQWQWFYKAGDPVRESGDVGGRNRSEENAQSFYCACNKFFT